MKFLDKDIENIIIDEFQNSQHAVVESEGVMSIVKTDYKLMAHAVMQRVLDRIMEYANQTLKNSKDQQDFMKTFFDGLNEAWENAERKN